MNETNPQLEQVFSKTIPNQMHGTWTLNNQQKHKAQDSPIRIENSPKIRFSNNDYASCWNFRRYL